MILSVITINYNNQSGLEKTVRSVYDQSYKDFEFIIVDGNSNDGSKNIINKCSNVPNSIAISEADTGIYNAMNKGVGLAHGDYCLFMNSGDVFFDNNVIKNVVPYLTGEFKILSGIGCFPSYMLQPVEPEQISLSFFLKESISHQSTFIERTLLLKMPYNENYKIVADLEFFFKALLLQQVTYKKLDLKISFCDDAGASGDSEKSFVERYQAIKSLLPKGMSYDVDFIVKYHNPIILKIGNILYKPLIRKISHGLKMRKMGYNHKSK